MAAVGRPDGTTIAYRRFRGPRAVLLVHGFASDGEATWERTGWVRTFAEAGRGAVVVDLRGHGASAKPTEAVLYSLELLAQDVLAVADAEDLAVFDIVGYSLGARVAQAVAAARPDRVAHLVLGGIGMRDPFAEWGPAAMRDALLSGQVIGDPTADRLISAPSLSQPEREALAACVSGLAGSPMPDMDSPVAALVVAGAEDSVAADAPELARHLGAPFVEVAGRHHVNAISARAFRSAVVAFLDQ